MTATNDDRRVVVVDWLGRGGIAQMALEWVRTLEADHEVTFCTRAGREIDAGPDRVLVGAPPGGAAIWHLRLLATVVTTIVRRRPRDVVVHNYHRPIIEVLVVAACFLVGSRLIMVVHNDRPHDGRPPAGLATLLRRADVVVCHSRYVADRCPATDPLVVPLPVPTLLTAAPNGEAPPPTTRRCLQTGVLGRGYKGGALVADLAACGVDGWEFRIAGAGAGVAVTTSHDAGRLTTRDEYLSLGDLRAELEQADVVILPYRAASQSGIVPAAHALGTIPIAHAVGGLPEQIDDGVDGILLPPDSDVTMWADVLRRLDDASKKVLIEGGRRRAAADDDEFGVAVRALIAPLGPS
jgi:hypothetical protein